MKTLCTLLLGALFGSTLHAQGVITRIGSDGTKFYYNGVADLQAVFDEADSNGSGKDTIIFSGGIFNLEQLPNGATTLYITSPVIIIGSGIRADSSALYGGRTEFSGSQRSIVLSNNADSTEMHGLTFSLSGGRGIYLGSNAADSNVDHVRLYRCSFSRLDLGWFDNNGGPSLANDIRIEQCVFHNEVWIANAGNVLITNSFLKRGLRNAINTQVKNCIMSGYGADLEIYNTSILYESGIFLWNGPSLTVGGSAVFTNCLFVGNSATFAQNVTFNPGVTHSGAQFAPFLTSAFPEVASPSGYTDHQFNGDYTLALPYLGTDGTPLGVYGGDAPWKDGSLPFNPHWSLLTTNANTTNGVLQGVHIKASAQEN